MFKGVFMVLGNLGFRHGPGKTSKKTVSLSVSHK